MRHEECMSFYCPLPPPLPDAPPHILALSAPEAPPTHTCSMNPRSWVPLKRALGFRRCMLAVAMLAQETLEVDPALDPRAVESWLISQRQPAHGMAVIITGCEQAEGSPCAL